MPNGDGTQMRVALQPADTKLQARFAMSVVVILVLRGLSLRVRIYVMTLVRSTAGINKEEEPAQDTANHVHRCVAAGFPDDVGQALAFHGWICQETLCGRISVTFLNEVTGRQD